MLPNAPLCWSLSQDLFQKLGGVIRDNEEVTDIKLGAVVTVSTAARVYRARSVVVTVGAWTAKLLAQTGLQLPLEVPRRTCTCTCVCVCVTMMVFQVVRVKVCYWREKIPGTYGADKRFPCFLAEWDESQGHIYGLPSHEYPGLVKVGHALPLPVEPVWRG